MNIDELVIKIKADIEEFTGALDRAKSDISSFGATVTSDIGGAFDTAAAQVDTATTDISASMDEASAHASSMGGVIENATAPTASLGEKISGLSKTLAGVGMFANHAMNMLDRYEISQMNVENATNNLTKSQENYTEAVKKFGEDSPQAKDAFLSLENSQNALEKANIRAEGSMVLIGISALGMIPQLIETTTAITTFAASGTVIATLSATVTGASTLIGTAITGLTTILLANPIILVIVAIIAAILLLKYAWDNNLGGIQEKTKAVFDWITGTLNALIMFFSEGWNKIGATVSNVISVITETLSGMATKAWDWGKNLITGFVDGIKSMLSSVANVGADIANTIAGYIGIHSPAEKGPLSHLTEWGPNLVTTYADGITRSLGMLDTAFMHMGNPQFSASGGSVGKSNTIILQPTYNIGGMGNTIDLKAVLESHDKDLLREIERRVM